MAPEVVAGWNYESNPKIDIWSLGCILYEMVLGEKLFRGSNFEEKKDKILRGKFILANSMTPELANLINKMIKINADERITIDECLGHPWTTGQKLSKEELLLDEKIRLSYVNKSSTSDPSNSNSNNNNNVKNKSDKIEGLANRKLSNNIQISFKEQKLNSPNKEINENRAQNSTQYFKWKSDPQIPEIKDSRFQNNNVNADIKEDNELISDNNLVKYSGNYKYSFEKVENKFASPIKLNDKSYNENNDQLTKSEHRNLNEELKPEIDGEINPNINLKNLSSLNLTNFSSLLASFNLTNIHNYNKLKKNKNVQSTNNVINFKKSNIGLENDFSDQVKGTRGPMRSNGSTIKLNKTGMITKVNKAQDVNIYQINYDLMKSNNGKFISYLQPIGFTKEQKQQSERIKDMLLRNAPNFTSLNSKKGGRKLSERDIDKKNSTSKPNKHTYNININNVSDENNYLEKNDEVILNKDINTSKGLIKDSSVDTENFAPTKKVSKVKDLKNHNRENKNIKNKPSRIVIVEEFKSKNIVPLTPTIKSHKLPNIEEQNSSSNENKNQDCIQNNLNSLENKAVNSPIKKKHNYKFKVNFANVRELETIQSSKLKKINNSNKENNKFLNQDYSNGSNKLEGKNNQSNSESNKINISNNTVKLNKTEIKTGILKNYKSEDEKQIRNSNLKENFLDNNNSKYRSSITKLPQLNRSSVNVIQNNKSKKDLNK